MSARVPFNVDVTWRVRCAAPGCTAACEVRHEHAAHLTLQLPFWGDFPSWTMTPLGQMYCSRHEVRVSVVDRATGLAEGLFCEPCGRVHPVEVVRTFAHDVPIVPCPRVTPGKVYLVDSEYFARSPRGAVPPLTPQPASAEEPPDARGDQPQQPARP